MKRAFLQNTLLCLLAALLTTSCGLAGAIDYIKEPYHPVPTSTTSFPTDQAGTNDRTATMGQECLRGKYVGQYVMEAFKKYVRDPPKWVKYAGTTPDGKRKIYKFYSIWKTPPPPPRESILEYSYYGYSFTIDTTDADIITECRVTKQFLYRL